jgi:cyanophycin synthetase
MKITATNSHNGKNGKQRITIRLSTGPLDQYNIDGIEGFSERLQHVLPAVSFRPAACNGPGCGAGVAEIIARIALKLQTVSGMPQTYWHVGDTAIAGTYDITIGCANETIGDYAARAAFRVVRSALYKQKYSLSPDLNMLKLMAQHTKTATMLSPARQHTAMAS